MSLYNSISIRPSYTCLFYQNKSDVCIRQENTNSLSNLDNNDHEGIISKRASKKIRNAINWLLEISQEKVAKPYKKGRVVKFKVAFATLTLPSKQIHSDVEIKNKCLNQFLIEARKKWGVRHYLWRAEAQKNGNIHFHITCDNFIPHTELRDTWNRIIAKLGYVAAYQTNMKEWHKNGFRVRTDLLKNWSKQAQKKAYIRGYASNWLSPNSTDIHSVKMISNLPAYLTKYCTKNDDGRAIKGKLWGLSYSLSQMQSVIIDEDTLPIGFIDALREKFKNKIKFGSFFAIIFVPWNQLKNYFNEIVHYIFNDYVDYFRHLYNPT